MFTVSPKVMINASANCNVYMCVYLFIYLLYLFIVKLHNDINLYNNTTCAFPSFYSFLSINVCSLSFLHQSPVSCQTQFPTMHLPYQGLPPSQRSLMSPRAVSHCPGNRGLRRVPKFPPMSSRPSGTFEHTHTCCTHTLSYSEEPPLPGERQMQAFKKAIQGHFNWALQGIWT